MSKLYVVLISESCVRDAQVIDPEFFPEGFDFDDYDAFWEFAQENDDCWQDCSGAVFLDVVRANSDEEAVEIISDMTGFDKRILTSIQIGE